MKIAIVHDWLVVKAGAESVLEELLHMFPTADVFTLVDFLPTTDRTFLDGHTIRTSFIQRLPFAKRRYRGYLPLMPLAIEQFDFSGYDLVISSSYAVAKGLITGPHQAHISYVHSPVRYAWDLQHTYLRESGLSKGVRSGLTRLLLHYIRLWDQRTAHGVDHYIANSHFIARRIKKIYGRTATVIYPPVTLPSWDAVHKDDFYLTASRLVPYKRVPLIVEAFRQMPNKRLVVIGDGPDMHSIRGVAGPNVEILGYQSRESLLDHMRRARAFIMAAEEDFGITPVEAQACGTPVIAYSRGGARETVVVDGPHPTGVFFDEQTPAALIRSIERFESRLGEWQPHACRANAERFDVATFRKNIQQVVDDVLASASLPNGTSLHNV